MVRVWSGGVWINDKKRWGNDLRPCVFLSFIKTPPEQSVALGMAGAVTPNETVPIRQIVINAIISCHPARQLCESLESQPLYAILAHVFLALYLCYLVCTVHPHAHTHTHRYCTISTKCSRGVTCHQMFIPRQSWKSYHIWQFSECQTEHFGFFFAYLGHKNEKSPSPRPKMFSSWPLNIWSKYYSTSHAHSDSRRTPLESQRDKNYGDSEFCSMCSSPQPKEI
jgi:hypothetical protein